MKNILSIRLPGFGASLLFLLCQACTSTTSMQVLQPAELTIPEHIQTIATVDRSKPEKGWITVLEGAISGEGIGQDKEGRRRALNGLTTTLTRTPRFEVRHTGMELTSSKGGGSLAPPLPWAEIEAICQRHDADAVVAIEMYDSDSYSSTSQTTEKRKDKDGNESVVTVFDSELEVSVQVGWRFYDPQNRIIIDEYTTRDDADANGRGDTEERALNDLPSVYSVVRDVSEIAGELYGMRIAPVWVNVNREFYTTAKGDFKAEMERANRYVKANEWEQASAIWRRIVENGYDGKAAGRAALNIAVAHERLDQLEKALEWAKRSYLDFDNKKARHYMTVLEQRINDRRRIDYQMNAGGND